MDIHDCPNCDRLRGEYSRVTRKELDLTIQLEQAAMNNESERLQQLRSLLAAVGEARAGVCETILDHENKHVSREALLQENKSSAAKCG